MRKIRPELVGILFKSLPLGREGWNVSPGSLASSQALTHGSKVSPRSEIQLTGKVMVP